MPTAGFIQLPDDSANAGKKRRTQTRTVGADTVHEEFAILQDPTNDDQARVLTSAPAGTEGGLVTRNIPGGTQAVSAAALPLPAGASTSAKQPALGTAGTASADVITVQGIAAMTALKVDGSGVTQPVSGPLTDTQLRASAIPMSLASLPALAAGTNAIGKLAANAGVTIGAVEIAAAQTLAVTNAGTFAVQAAQSGTWNIGTLTTLTGITNVVHVDDNAGSLTIDGTVTASNAAGDIAHDAADSGNPVKIGGKASTGLPTAVTAGDRCNIYTDLYGRQASFPGSGTWAINHQPAAATQATITRASAGAGIKNVCTGLSIWCITLGTAPTAANLVFNLRDGASGAGTVLASWTLRVPATTQQNLQPIVLSGLWLEGTAATAMTLESSGAPGTNVQCGVNLQGTTTA